jgi:outer membrane immunogenic protein
MNRFILSAGACVLAAAMASPSFAADMPGGRFKEPIFTAPAFGWSGLYIGINGGYGWARSNWNSALTSGSTDPTGGQLGGTVGYNVQAGTFVFGLEGDFGGSWMKGSDTSGTGVCAIVACDTTTTWLATARGRLGFAFDRALIYGTGGAAVGDIKMSANTGLSETEERVGWTAGGGLEYALPGPWSAKVEYLYVDLGTANCSVLSCGIDTDVTFKANIVRIGVNYRFW